MARCFGRLRVLAAQLTGGGGGSSPGQPDYPPLGSLEGEHPSLRTFSVAQLGTGRTAGADEEGEAAAFALPLPDSHPAAVHFREWGYCVIHDALGPDALARVARTFHSKQAHALAVWQALERQQPVKIPAGPDADPGAVRHAKRLVEEVTLATRGQPPPFYDLPREDMGACPEAWRSGANGAFLVTRESSDFDNFMGALANPRVLPLLGTLLGPRLALMEAGARTVVAPTRDHALESGGYRHWHRDYGGDGARLPINHPDGDYSRVKCFLMLKDTAPDGGPLGLMPMSHRWQGNAPAEYQGARSAELPGSVKLAVPAGAMCLFDMRTWHAALPLTNGVDRESLICTYGSEPPHIPKGHRWQMPGVTADLQPGQWPVGGYGAEPATVEGDGSGREYCREFLGCGRELEAMGRLNTPVRRQLFGVQLVGASSVAGASATTATTIVHSMREVAPLYDAFILDQWGVLHDGTNAMAGAVDCFAQLANAGKKLIILSNDGARKQGGKTGVSKLEGMGFDTTPLVGSVLAGEEAIQWMLSEYTAEKLGGRPVKCSWLAWSGAGFEASYIDGLNIELVPCAEAELIIAQGTARLLTSEADLTGPPGRNMHYDQTADGSEVPRGYNESIDDQLRAAAANGALLVCCNPDMKTVRHDKESGAELTEYCPGGLLRFYESIGGAVRPFGKPYAEHFEACLRALGIADKSRVAMVGDALETDVRGARSAGLDSVLVASGIHGAALGCSGAVAGLPDAAKLESLCAAFGGAVPTFAAPRFVW